MLRKKFLKSSAIIFCTEKNFSAYDYGNILSTAAKANYNRISKTKLFSVDKNKCVGCELCARHFHRCPKVAIDYDNCSLRNLLQRPYRFNELKKSIEGIRQKVLTDSLRSMEKDGIVNRKVYTDSPLKVEYSLSELGESMRPIIFETKNFSIHFAIILCN